ncbi:hypothetical protein [Haloferula sp. BvORR071]|uniref:hypothetical protein n=1 Tax=Haloferula sp. BvORR071 TaxID=1396141 RepID=UPI00054F9C72|nr:hypothetical protein [Haloferula sp. BvORR071]
MKLLALPLLFVFASCSTQSCWKGGEPMRQTEMRSQWGAEIDINQSANNVKIYRGLAHPVADKGAYERQVKRGGWVEFQGFKFFAQPYDAKPGTAEKVLDIYKLSASHEAQAIKTTCAGFHPDYALVWSKNGKQRVLQICYGCHEWKYFGPGGKVHTDIEDKTYFQKLIPLLPKARERPRP